MTSGLERKGKGNTLQLRQTKARGEWTEIKERVRELREHSKVPPEKYEPGNTTEGWRV